MGNIFETILPEGYYGDGPLIIAGPCSAESREQVLETASALSDVGVRIFRAGIWKPRTKPGNFEGIGEIGLEWLKEVKERFAMLVATEVATKSHVDKALEAGVDILWVGARTTANPFSVQEVAEAIASMGKDPVVIVKNPVSPDIELWAGALERFRKLGINRLMAVHRGFSSYGNTLYRNPPFWQLPFELKRRYPQLPLITDPSHMGGTRDLVAPLGRQALLMGFDGLMIESHCAPDRALSDAMQQITPQQLKDLLASVSTKAGVASDERLESLRREIDDCDNRLVELLAERMQIARNIGELKKTSGMPVLQTERHDEVMNTRVSKGMQLGMSGQFLNNLFSSIHAESVRQQIELLQSK